MIKWSEFLECGHIMESKIKNTPLASVNKFPIYIGCVALASLVSLPKLLGTTQSGKYQVLAFLKVVHPRHSQNKAIYTIML